MQTHSQQISEVVAVTVQFCCSSSLVELEKGIKGLVVMSSSLEETFNCIYEARVPPLWVKVSTHRFIPSFMKYISLIKLIHIDSLYVNLIDSFFLSMSDHQAYPSLKPLAAWTRDLCQRVEQFAHWAETAEPPNLFWLSGFTFPNSFLTAVLQTFARQHNVRVYLTPSCRQKDIYNTFSFISRCPETKASW